MQKGSSRVCRECIFSVLYHLEFEADLLATNDQTHIMLPEFTCKTHCGPFSVKIYEHLKAEEPPEFQCCDIARDRAKPHVRVEIKIAPILDERVECI